MAISEHESAGPIHLSSNLVEKQPALFQFEDRLALDALSTQFARFIPEFWPDVEDDYTDILKRKGQYIGAVSIAETYASEEGEPAAVEIELFDTNPANFHSGYLATVQHAIDKYTDAVTVYGLNNGVFAKIAAEIVDRLPQGWYCEYTILDADSVYYSYEEALSMAGDAQKLRHSFQKIRPI